MKYFKIIIIGFVLLFLISACKTEQIPEENTVKMGSTVTFDYASGFDNGTLFDTSFENIAREAGIYNPNRVYQPESIVIGKDPLLPALVDTMIGKKQDETLNLRLMPEQAYGRKIENSLSVIPRNLLSTQDIVIGEVILIATPEGSNIPVFVKEINEDNVTIDQNHPLAGEIIQFAIIIRGIE
jgi:FKBP-type peptidyl-prolyl cis-trans isomerase 2